MHHVVHISEKKTDWIFVKLLS